MSGPATTKRDLEPCGAPALANHPTINPGRRERSAAHADLHPEPAVSDFAGTKRTAYAAGWNGEHLHSDDTRDGAIGQALEDLFGRIDSGDQEPRDSYTVRVFRDVLWCVGSDDGEDCYCGAGHDDDRWLMIACDHWTEHALAVVLDAEGYVERIDVGDETPDEDGP